MLVFPGAMNHEYRAISQAHHFFRHRTDEEALPAFLASDSYDNEIGIFLLGQPDNLQVRFAEIRGKKDLFDRYHLQFRPLLEKQVSKPVFFHPPRYAVAPYPCRCLGLGKITLPICRRQCQI